MPRAIFIGAMLLNLIPSHISCLSLFQASVDYLVSNIDEFGDILTKSKQEAINDLNSFLNNKDCNADSNIVDMILVTLAKMAACCIKVYYEYHGGQPQNKPDRGRVQKYNKSIVGVPTL